MHSARISVQTVQWFARRRTCTQHHDARTLNIYGSVISSVLDRPIMHPYISIGSAFSSATLLANASFKFRILLMSHSRAMETTSCVCRAPVPSTLKITTSCTAHQDISAMDSTCRRFVGDQTRWTTQQLSRQCSMHWVNCCARSHMHACT